MRRLPALLALVLAGCLPVDVSHYGTAKPLGQGTAMLGGGVMVPRDGGSGFNRDQSTGAPVTTHHAASYLSDNFNLYGAYGLTPTTDVSLKLWELGVQAGVKQNLVNADVLEIAVGAYGSAWYNDWNTTENSGQTDEYRKHVWGHGTVLEFPATISLHPAEGIAFYGGPFVQRWDTSLHHYSQRAGQNADIFDGSGHHWYEGAFAGVVIGRSIELNMGATMIRESRTYPEKDFSGDVWFAYPYVGLTFAMPPHGTTQTPPPGP